jgi:hypothetical protein
MHLNHSLCHLVMHITPQSPMAHAPISHITNNLQCRGTYDPNMDTLKSLLSIIHTRMYPSDTRHARSSRLLSPHKSTVARHAQDLRHHRARSSHMARHFPYL